MKRAALYRRVSTLDQNPDSQLFDLQALARQRDLEIVHDYVDHGISGARVKRPTLDQMMADARRGQFEVVLIWACDRLARSVRHFLEVVDELNHLNIEFVSFRENIDTGGPLGRAIVTIISAIAELERSLIIERVRAGMRRARLEGKHVGRPRLQLDHAEILRQHAAGCAVGELTRAFGASRATIHRILQENKHEEEVASQAVAGSSNRLAV